MELEKNKKLERDAQLGTEVASYTGKEEALLQFNQASQERLQTEINTLSGVIEQTRTFLEARKEELSGSTREELEHQGEVTRLTAARNRLEEEIQHTRTQRNEAQSFIDNNKDAYRKLIELLEKFKKDDISIEELQQQLQALSREIAELAVQLSENEGNLTRSEYDKNRSEEQINLKQGNLNELSDSILLAENFLRKNPSEESLQNELAALDTRLTGLKSDQTTEIEHKEELLGRLSAYLFLLNQYKAALQSSFKDIDAKLLGLDKDYRDIDGDCQAEDKKQQAIEIKMEQDPLPQIQDTIRNLEEEKRIAARERKTTGQNLENVRNQLNGHYQVLRVVYPALEERFIKLESHFSRLAGEINAASGDKKAKETELEELQRKIAAHPPLGDYLRQRDEIKERLNEYLAQRPLLAKDAQDVDRLITGFEQGRYSQDQEKARKKQPFRTYKFSELFGLTDGNLEDVIAREKRLSLLKTTIFVEASSREVVPQSGHFHVPLKNYEPELTNREPLPFGLAVCPSAPAIAARAVTWLREVAALLLPDGQIQDAFGLRGYDPDDLVYYLSESTKTWHHNKLGQRLRNIKARIAEIDEALDTLEAAQAAVESKMEELKGLLSQQEMLTKQQKDLERRLVDLNEEHRRVENEKTAFHERIEQLEPIVDGFKKYATQIGSIANYSVSPTGLEETTDRLLREQVMVKQLLEQFDPLLRKFQSLNDSLARLEKQLEEWEGRQGTYFQLAGELEKKKQAIADLTALLEHVREEIRIYNESKEACKRDLNKIAKRLEEYSLYFRELEPAPPGVEIPFGVLLEKTSYLYNDYRRRLDRYEQDIEKLTQTIQQTEDLIISKKRNKIFISGTCGRVWLTKKLTRS